MLAADKLQLTSSLKQQATALKEKEFNLHHSNLMTVGTQAAVLAGLDVTMFIEFQPPPNSEWNPEIIGRALKFIYYITITSAFCANILVVSQTTIVSVLGAGMALRGPDGSMFIATDGLYEERTSVFLIFGIGLACTLGSVLICVWLVLHWEAAIICMGITMMTCRKVYVNYHRVVRRFDFDESETVDFKDIFGSSIYSNNNNNRHSKSSRNNSQPQQQQQQNYKKNTPSSRNRRRTNNKRNEYYHEDGSNSITSDDENEMQLMVPKNFNSRSGVQRRGPGGNSSVSNASLSQESYDDFRIQTV